MDDINPDINSGDVFEDEHGNEIRVLSSEGGVTRVEYRLPTQRFEEKFGENRVTEPKSDLLLIERLRSMDQYFPELNHEGFPYESPLRDETVERLDVVSPFDLDLESDLNLFTFVVGVGHEGMILDTEQFPGLIYDSSGDFDSGFVVLFEDGLGAAFEKSESAAENRIEELRTLVEMLLSEIEQME